MLSDQIKTYILDALSRGHAPTVVEIMAHFNCSRRTAQYTRATLVREGLIPAGIFRRGGRPRLPKTIVAKAVENGGTLVIDKIETDDPLSEIVNRVMSGKATPLTTEQQRALLSELILHSPNHAIKVAAQNSLTKLDAQSGKGVSYAPSPPITAEQKAERLSLLMKACGHKITREAFALAFPRILPLDTADA